MERYIVFLVLFASTAAEVLHPSKSKTYRDDYEYNPRTDSFYKLHADQMSHYQAAHMCQSEGAALMVTRSIQDLAEVHALLKAFPDIGDYIWVGEDGEVHETAEEEAVIKFSEETFDAEGFRQHEMPTCTVLSREGQLEEHSCGQYSRDLAFVCMVDAASATFDSHCQVYSKDYVYKDSVGSCYKISKEVLTWNEAYSECKHEGAHLLVLNSKAESEVIKGMLSGTRLLHDSTSPYYYIVGIRAMRGEEPRVFRTVFNETLEAAGFAEWAYTEPNNLGGNEYCGSVYEGDGKYNDHSCPAPFGYICEKEIKVSQ